VQRFQTFVASHLSGTTITMIDGLPKAGLHACSK
jgi:hypothetical protein